MRQIAIKSIPVILLVLLCTPIFAEAVFLNDGSIVEGKIVKDTGIDLILEMPNGPDTSIPRESVLRVLYHEKFKKVVSLHKADGSVLKGYIVEENNDDYVLRQELYSPVEITIGKSEVDVIVINEKKQQNAKPKPLWNVPQHSPALAVFTSSFPIWSGSFNDGFQPIDGLGIAFVLLKSASVVMMGVSFGLNTSGQYSLNTSQGLAMFNMELASFVLLPAFTIGDMIFSGLIVTKNTRAKMHSVQNDDESTVAFSFYPRMEYCYDRSLDPRGMYGSVDSGINIAAVCRW